MNEQQQHQPFVNMALDGSQGPVISKEFFAFLKTVDAQKKERSKDYLLRVAGVLHANEVECEFDLMSATSEDLDLAALGGGSKAFVTRAIRAANDKCVVHHFATPCVFARLR